MCRRAVYMCLHQYLPTSAYTRKYTGSLHRASFCVRVPVSEFLCVCVSVNVQEVHQNQRRMHAVNATLSCRCPCRSRSTFCTKIRAERSAAAPTPSMALCSSPTNSRFAGFSYSLHLCYCTLSIEKRILMDISILFYILFFMHHGTDSKQ